MKNIISFILCVFIFGNNFLPVWASSIVEENNYIKTERQTIKLHSKLNNLYTGYEFSIKNIYSEPVKITNIFIWDNASGKVAFLSVKKSSKKAAGEFITQGMEYAIPTLTLSFWGALFVSPFVALKNSFSNSQAKRESKKYNNLTFSNIQLKSGETYKIKTLALKKYNPLIRIMFINPITDEKMNIEIIK